MRLTVVISMLLLGACEVRTTEDAANEASPAPFAPAAPVAPAAPQAPAAPVTPPADEPPPPHQSQDPQPSLPDEKSALGAARRLLEYCDAVATHRYADAYRLWSDNGAASGMTLKQFSDSFAKYAAYDCHIGTPGDTEGAAGSIYVDIPLKVTGVLVRGGGFVLDGPVTLRRVNDVDGSTAEQRRWHIMASGLKPRP